MAVPGATPIWQAELPLPHVIPPPVTWPGPSTATVRMACCGGIGSKCAYTCVSAATAMEQAMPWQPLPKPAKVQPAPAVAVSVTWVPSVKGALQEPEEQSRPAGLEMTRPEPSMITETLCEPGGGGAFWVKAAETLASAVRARSQLPLPEQAPVQPVKVEPSSATAERCTSAPLVSWTEQLPRQSWPAPRTRP